MTRKEWEKLLPSEEDIAFIKRMSKTIQENTTTCRIINNSWRAKKRFYSEVTTSGV